MSTYPSSTLVITLALLSVGATSPRAQTANDIVDHLPPPLITQDASRNVCRQTSFPGGWGFDMSVPQDLIQRYRSSPRLGEAAAAWGRRHLAKGKTPMDCPIVDLPFVVGHLNAVANRPDAGKPTWTAHSLRMLFTAEDRALQQARAAAESRRPQRPTRAPSAECVSASERSRCIADCAEPFESEIQSPAAFARNSHMCETICPLACAQR